MSAPEIKVSNHAEPFSVKDIRVESVSIFRTTVYLKLGTYLSGMKVDTMVRVLKLAGKYVKEQIGDVIHADAL